MNYAVDVEPKAAISLDEFRLATLEEIEAIVAGVARSIEALDAGTYGLCEVCGEAVSPAVISDDPLAVRCEQHQ